MIEFMQVSDKRAAKGPMPELDDGVPQDLTFEIDVPDPVLQPDLTDLGIVPEISLAWPVMSVLGMVPVLNSLPVPVQTDAPDVDAVLPAAAKAVQVQAVSLPVAAPTGGTLVMVAESEVQGQRQSLINSKQQITPATDVVQGGQQIPTRPPTVSHPQPAELSAFAQGLETTFEPAQGMAAKPVAVAPVKPDDHPLAAVTAAPLVVPVAKADAVHAVESPSPPNFRGMVASARTGSELTNDLPAQLPKAQISVWTGQPTTPLHATQTVPKSADSPVLPEVWQGPERGAPVPSLHPKTELTAQPMAIPLSELPKLLPSDADPESKVVSDRQNVHVAAELFPASRQSAVFYRFEERPALSDDFSIPVPLVVIPKTKTELAKIDSLAAVTRALHSPQLPPANTAGPDQPDFFQPTEIEGPPAREVTFLAPDRNEPMTDPEGLPQEIPTDTSQTGVQAGAEPGIDAAATAPAPVIAAVQPEAPPATQTPPDTAPTVTGLAVTAPEALDAPQPARILAEALPLQVAQQITAHSADRAEIVLSPAELGRLRFEITPRGDAVQIVIMAERPETLDLLRRNADQFLTDLKSMGFSGSELCFGAWGGNSDRPSQEFESDHAEGATSAELAAPQRIVPVMALQSTGGLDLRL